MDQQKSMTSNSTQKRLDLQIQQPQLVQNPSVDLKNILQLKLQQYQDIEQDEFELVEDNFQQQIRQAKQYQTTYMHQHSNVIPIGTNYQALIPQLLPQQHYKIRSRQMMNRLRVLKINDPIKLNQFVLTYNQIIKKYFQQFQLTQEDYSIMYNNYKQYGNQGDVPFNQYLDKTLIYWNKYFLGKQKIVAKNVTKRKKKRTKGSIPI